MGGGGDIRPYRFPLGIKKRFVEDILGLFHHYHHSDEGHVVHHCEHTGDLEIVHCGCLTMNNSTQHAVNVNQLECMVHLPDLTGIPTMELSLKEVCPKLGHGWYHLGSLATEVSRVYNPLRQVVGR